MQNNVPTNSAYIRPGTPGDVVNLCIGGILFITRRATLYRLPDSRLYMIATQGVEELTTVRKSKSSDFSESHNQHIFNPGGYTVGGATVLPNSTVSNLYGNKDLISAAAVCRTQTYSSNEQSNLTTKDIQVNQTSEPLHAPQPVYFFDRDPEIFRFVLDYYRTGELHLPTNICGPFVRKELIFWGIDESLIDPCCMPAYMRYDEEKRTKQTLFRDCFEDIDSMQNLVKFSRGWKQWRYRLWLFMDHPTSSYAAKMWAMLLLVLMIASVLCYCFSTSSIFRKAAWAARTVRTHSAYPELYNFSQLADDPLDICDDSVNLNNPKIRKDCLTEPTPGLVIFDITLNLIFTTEFILKVLLAPDKPRFLTSIVSIIDMLILFTYWIYISVFYFVYYQKKPESVLNLLSMDKQPGNLWLLNILSMTQAMRIMRIFKISKTSRGLRVLILTVKKSIPELVLLAFLLMNGMFMFSCMIYMAEYSVNDTFIDIPQAFWWSIITLTTVGYGDAYPKGTAGYIIGSIAAVSGCIVTGLAIPIIGNNFNTYYMYMKNQLKEDKYLKELRKDINSTSMGNLIKGFGGFAEKTGLPLLHRKYRQFRADKQCSIGNRATANANSNAKREHDSQTLKKANQKQDKQTGFNCNLKSNRKQKCISTSLSSESIKKSLLFVEKNQETIDSLSKNDAITYANEELKLPMESQINCNSINPTLELSFDRRTSMVYPLATDGVLSSLPLSTVKTQSEFNELDKIVENDLEIGKNSSSSIRKQMPITMIPYTSKINSSINMNEFADAKSSACSINTNYPKSSRTQDYSIYSPSATEHDVLLASPTVQANWESNLNMRHNCEIKHTAAEKSLKRNYV